MLNLLAVIIVATSEDATACNDIQKSVITRLHGVYASEPVNKTMCLEWSLFYRDSITKDVTIGIEQDWRVAICKYEWKIKCVRMDWTIEQTQDEFLKKYNEQLNKVII